MKCVSAKDAKNEFGRLLDTARAEPVIIEKHGRAVIVVLAIEEYERLVSGEASDQSTHRTTKTKGE
jgi:prevent-host-death family protein